MSDRTHPPLPRPATTMNGGLYDPAFEHDSCGVGLIAALDGTPRRDVVEAGIAALKAVWHRGAVDADGMTGDGAGIHVEIPQDFFREHVEATGQGTKGRRLAVGMVFLPKTDLGAQDLCRSIVETEILRFGHGIQGWRQVPIDSSVIGEKANASRPEIEQVMVANERGVDDDQFEIDLYVMRRRIEKQVLDHHITGFYICSLSSRSLIYKGMFLAEHARRSIRTCWTSASSRASRSSTSATRPTPSPPGAWRSPSACSPTTARSTPCAATRTGWRATRRGPRATCSALTTTSSSR